MSDLNIRTLLSKTVTAIKEKLSIDSFTWGEYEDKLAEAISGGGENELLKIYVSGDGIMDDVTPSIKDVSVVRPYAFAGCTTLYLLDLSSATSIGENAFYDSGLNWLFLRRTDDICSITADTFKGTILEDGYSLKVYVPSALRESYENLGLNLTYPNLVFYNLEDYTLDGTVTGELDRGKLFVPS